MKEMGLAKPSGLDGAYGLIILGPKTTRAYLIGFGCKQMQLGHPIESVPYVIMDLVQIYPTGHMKTGQKMDIERELFATIVVKSDSQRMISQHIGNQEKNRT